MSAILEAVRRGYSTVAAVAEHTGATQKTVRAHLAALGPAVERVQVGGAHYYIPRTVADAAASMSGGSTALGKALGVTSRRVRQVRQERDLRARIEELERELEARAASPHEKAHAPTGEEPVGVLSEADRRLAQALDRIDVLEEALRIATRPRRGLRARVLSALGVTP
jgi:DNA-binding transcriptional ArsR family regulator